MAVDLTGKVAVVTGGGGILCSAMAKALAKQGAKVAILDLKEESAKAATQYTKLHELMTEKEQAEQALEEKMDRWVYLNDLAEQIAQGK